MNVLISGGTGFIGTHLTKALTLAGHDVYILSRSKHPSTNNITYLDISALDNITKKFDAVINLAGAPIADQRWSSSRMTLLRQSRITSTNSILNYLRRCEYKPKVFISGSAIGFYGTTPSNDAIDESAQGDQSFSSQLCQEWEECAMKASTELGIRTCLIRTGIVLGSHGGALKRMLLPFRLGLGGVIGNGFQWMPWIHMHDIVDIIKLCIDNESISGPINAASPNPVTNREFTKALANQLHRPALLPMPSPIVKLVFGQMGEELLLAGKKVVPSKALEQGYRFKFEHIDQALADCLK